MKNIRFIKKQMKSITAFMLVVAMVVTSLPYVTLANNEPIQSPLEQISFEDLISNELIPDDELFEFSGSGTIEAERLQERFSLEHTEINIFNLNNTSQRRQMYFQLLEGNYPAVELISRFEEMFGVFSATYIRENFTTIFDISTNEIDEGLLNIIAPVMQWRAEQFEASSQQNFARDIQMHMFDNAANTYNLFHDLSFDASSFDGLIFEQELYDNSSFDEPIHHVWDFNYTDYELDLSHFIFDNELTEADTTSFTPNETNGFIDIAQTSFSGNSDVSIRLISVTDTTIVVETFYNPSHFSGNNILHLYDFTTINPGFNGAWRQLQRPMPSGTSRFTISGLIPGAVYRVGARVFNSTTSTWIDAEITVRTNGARTPSLTISNVTPTGFTVNAVFPSNRDHGNRLVIWNGFDEWVDVAGTSNNLSSGSFNVNNLTPGMRYRVVLQYINRLSGSQYFNVESAAQTPLPPQNIVTFTRSNVEFRFDRFFADAFNPGLLNRFLDGVNNAYAVQHSLIGGALPLNGERMRFETSRDLPWWIEGMSGQPITWSVWNEGFHIATNHLLMMNRHNVHMTEVPVHEIAHNFQQSRWLFEAEALAIFQTYYHFYMTNESMVVSNQDMVFTGGSGFKRYMRSYANRILGHISFDAAMAQNAYSPYSLAWTLANIQTRIGWEPFRQTFRAFDSMPQNQVPRTSIGKLNLFLSMLQDFSGQNVFNMLSAQERQVYEARLGGAIQYIRSNQFIIPNNLRWLMHFDVGINRQIYITASPLRHFGPFDNVHVGIQRTPNSSTGEVFVLNNNRWTRIGTVRFIGTSVPQGAEGISAFTDGDNFVMDYYMNGGTSGISTPENVTNPSSNNALNDLHRMAWDSLNRPDVGSLVYRVVMPLGNEVLLTHAEVLERFGAATANELAAEVARLNIGGISPRFLFTDPITLTIGGVALLTIAVIAIYHVVTTATINLNDALNLSTRPMFDFWVIFESFSSLFTAPTWYIFPEPSLNRVWGAAPLIMRIQGIAEGFELGQCVEAADAMERHLTRTNQHNFERITIRYAGNPMLTSLINTHLSMIIDGEPWDGAISNNGVHTGVLINETGLVHCVVHPTGLPLEVWLNDIVTIRPGYSVAVTPIHYSHLKTRLSQFG